MFRSRPSGRPWAPCRPRGRGDVPLQGDTIEIAFQSAPRTRGCSAVRTCLFSAVSVGPADAGMFPTCCPCPPPWPHRPLGRGDVPWYPSFKAIIDGSARGRGDVPYVILTAWHLPSSASRTRGCSRARDRAGSRPHVGPADAGMFPSGPAGPRRCYGRPCGRGDVPLKAELAMPESMSAPQTRGCSLLQGDVLADLLVGPRGRLVLPT